jgi:hypothetical protein
MKTVALEREIQMPPIAQDDMREADIPAASSVCENSGQAPSTAKGVLPRSPPGLVAFTPSEC